MAKKRQKLQQKIPVVQPRSVESKINLSGVSRYLPLGLVLFFLIFYLGIISGGSFLWEDVTEQTFPYLTNTLYSIKHALFPFWTPFIFSGMPFFADLQTSLLYPPHWILFFVSLFSHSHSSLLSIFIVSHVLIWGFGIYLLCIHFGFRRISALFTSTVFMFTASTSLLIIHDIYIFVYTWFPFILLFLDKSFKSGRLKHLMIAAIFFTVSSLGGYAQASMNLVYLFFGWTVFTIIVNRKEPPRKLVGYFLYFCILIGIGLALAGVQLLSTYELMQQSVRQTMTFETSSMGSVPFSHFLTFLAPQFFGYVGPGVKSSYWGFPSQSFLFWETTGFIGVGALLLSVGGFLLLRKKPVVGFFACVALVAFFIALGNNTPVYGLIFNYVPGFHNFRIPGRYIAWFSYALIFISGFGLDAMLKNEINVKKYLLVLFPSAGIILAGGLLFLSGSFDSSSQYFQYEQILSGSKHAITVMMITAVIGAALIYYLVKASNKLPAAICLVIMAFAELYAFGKPFADSPSPFEPYYLSTDFSGLNKLLEKDKFRIQTRLYQGPSKGEMLLPRNLGEVAYIPLTEGYNQFILQRYSELLNGINDSISQKLLTVRFKKVPGQASLAEMPVIPRFYCSPFISVFNNRTEIESLMNKGTFIPGKTVALEKNPPLQMDTTNGMHAGIEVVSENPNRIVLDATAEGNTMLCTSEIYYPAWKASVDGKKAEVFASNYAFRAVPLEKGKHRVIMYYDSDYTKLGLLISLISLFIIIGIFLLKKPSQAIEKLLTGN